MLPAWWPRRAPKSVGIVHFDAHADTADEDWGLLLATARPCPVDRVGAVDGRNFVQVGLRGYWPPAHVRMDKGARSALAFMREIEERAVVDDAIAEALAPAPIPVCRRSTDVLDPGRAPARLSRAACSRASCCAPCRIVGRSISPEWT